MIHIGCWEAWVATEAPACAQCAAPLTEQHYILPDARVHLGCYDQWLAAHGAPTSQHSKPTSAAPSAALSVGGAPSVSGMPPVLLAPLEAPTHFVLGWFWKRGKGSRSTGRHSWKRRWAMVHVGCLMYYADEGMRSHKGSVRLAGCRVTLTEISHKATPRDSGAQWGFELATPTHIMLAFPVGRSGATSRAEAAPWVLSLNEAIEEADEAMAMPARRLERAAQEELFSRVSHIRLGREEDDD